MKMNFDNFEITADAYYKRAAVIIDQFNRTLNPSFLFYAVLEFRFCIERLLFEYIVILSKGDMSRISKSMEKLYRAKNLKDQILELEPDFVCKIQFINLFFEAIGAQAKMKTPDLDSFEKLYGQLGDYLHAPKRPDKSVKDPEWWNHLHNLLSQLSSTLIDILRHPIASFDPTDSGWALFNKFKSGEIDEAEVIAQLRKSR